MKPDELLSTIKTGSEALRLLDSLTPELDSIQQEVSRKTLQKLDSDSLTEREALNAWLEIHAIERIKRKLSQKVRAGQGAGKRYEVSTN